jgi:DNA-binding transcriptional ArsR family regulator
VPPWFLGKGEKMVRVDADLSAEEAAAFHDGLAHPARVAAMRALREQPVMPMAELRRRVAEAAGDLDTRSMQFHAAKMERAGLVDVRRDGTVALLRDVSLKLRLVPGA